VDFLKVLAVQGYKEYMERMKQLLTSRHWPTESDMLEVQSWHVTRLNTVRPIFQYVRQLHEKIGSGTFGIVYQAFDQATGHAFAIKVVNLGATDNTGAERAMLHRRIKVMGRLS
jgi:hypothetical protein